MLLTSGWCSKGEALTKSWTPSINFNYVIQVVFKNICQNCVYHNTYILLAVEVARARIEPADR